ncbi:MAG: hypothetical protein FJ100_11370 [Deltaproteobacteria bacterium]|nr:hypothetical protein [Deltaproteobacteria bacterium]
MKATALAGAVACASAPALAAEPVPLPQAGFADLAAELDGAPHKSLDWQAHFRSRGELLHNLDLDRGLDPQGRPLFAVPPSAPAAQTLRHADVRLRTDFTLRTPRGGGLATVRLDWFDNLALGSAPNAPPAAATGQDSPASLATLRRAYAVAALPFGAVAIGRMNAHWGTGMVSHGGDGLDTDRGDASDRVAFVTPLAGHIWAIAYDWSATGPQTTRPDGNRVVDLDPADDVRSATLAVLNVRSDVARHRRLRAKKTTVEYGAYVSTRWQDRDVPASWAGDAKALGRADWVRRGLRVYGGDVWLRASGPWGEVEAEGALVRGGFEQASLLPGVHIRQPIEVAQYGAVLRSRLGTDAGWAAGLDGGLASGDAAPGVASPHPGDGLAPAGSLRGAQIDPPRDARLTEFRMHGDFRIDRILFRELYGAVADAAWLRPHVRWTAPAFGAGTLRFEMAVIQSWALAAASAPGGQRPLGLELDPTVTYATVDGVVAQFQYALLLPQAGLDNPARGQGAQPAQLARLLLRWEF